MAVVQSVDQILRVDHAGECGAIRIYRSQMDHQVEVLARSDPEALAAVESIRRDEAAHEEHAIQHGGEGRGMYRLLRWMVKGATGLAIWMSTKL